MQNITCFYIHLSFLYYEHYTIIHWFCCNYKHNATNAYLYDIKIKSKYSDLQT